MKYFGWIFLFFIALYILPISSRPMLSPDEFLHAGIAREMVMSGDYVIPSFAGEQVNTLPMTYWLTAGSFKLFGINTFAARLPAALAVGICAILIALLIQQNLRDEKLAALAATIFMAFSAVIFSCNIAARQIIFVMAFAGSAGTVFLALQEPKFNRRKLLLLILSGLFTSLGILCDGYNAIIFPALVIIPFILISRKFKDLIIVPIIQLIFALLPLWPWFGDIVLADYFSAITSFASWKENFGLHHWYSYAAALGIGLLPVIILVPAALMTGKESWKRLLNQPLCKFAILGLIMPLIYLSITRNEPVMMILTAFPALAILIALGIQAYFNNGGHHRSFDWMLNVWALFLTITGIIEVVLWFMRTNLLHEYFSALPVTNLFLINLGVSSIIGGGVILYSLRGNWRSRLYLFFFSVAILPLAISWCFSANVKMPGNDLHTIIRKGGITDSCTVITRKEFIPAVSWYCRWQQPVKALEGDVVTYETCSFVILPENDPAWLKTPEKCKNSILCGVFRGDLH